MKFPSHHPHLYICEITSLLMSFRTINHISPFWLSSNETKSFSVNLITSSIYQVFHLASCRCRRRAFLRSGHSIRDPGCHSYPCSTGCCRLLLSSTPHTHSTRDPRQSWLCCIFRGPNSCWDKSLF